MVWTADWRPVWTVGQQFLRSSSRFQEIQNLQVPSDTRIVYGPGEHFQVDLVGMACTSQVAGVMADVNSGAQRLRVDLVNAGEDIQATVRQALDSLDFRRMPASVALQLKYEVPQQQTTPAIPVIIDE